MHEAAVLSGYRDEQVLERVLVLALNCQHRAQMSVVVLPENHVLCVLKTVKYRLHGYDW